MSWAALNRELRELLPRLALPADLGTARELEKRVHGLGGSQGALSRLQDAGLRPSSAEADALRE